jgi:hypothetical protein
MRVPSAVMRNSSTALNLGADVQTGGHNAVPSRVDEFAGLQDHAVGLAASREVPGLDNALDRGVARFPIGSLDRPSGDIGERFELEDRVCTLCSLR